jgi:hypothetical protein
MLGRLGGAAFAAAMVVLVLAVPAAAQMPGGAPQAPPGALQRYWSPSAGTHWVTPTPVAGDYAFEFSLGFLHTTPGAGRVAVYGCRSGGSDYFLSHDAGCEGRTALGRYGWLDQTRTEGSVPLYRCWINASGSHMVSTDAACEGQTTESRLGYARARQPALSRYWNANTNTHTISSGLVGGGHTLEWTLGFLLQSGGPNRRAVYECAAGADRFLSLDSGCEGRSELGRAGFVYAAPPGTEEVTPLYRCVIPGQSHFASPDPACEGQTTESRLGYLRRTQEVLNRAYNPSNGTHWVTSGGIGPGWFFEFSLGYVLTRDGGDRRPLYGCLAGSADHFLSLDARCEGQQSEGRLGWVHTAPPAGVEHAGLYRCRTGTGHFASLDPGCERTQREGQLGFIRTAAPEGPPPPPVPLRLTCATSPAQVTASLRGRKVRRVRYGGTTRLTGRVRNLDGTRAAGAQVLILIGNRKPVVFGQAVTGPKGRYSFRVRPGKNRIIHVGFRPTATAPDLACSRRVRVNVRAGVRLSARPKRVPLRGSVRFRGRLLGKPIPKVGKLIDLQAFDGGRWRTFETTRANRKGRFRARYSFVRTTSARTFRFRARARRESRYPYALGVSKVVRVRVR